MLTSLLASILLTQSAMDHGVLIGLRDQKDALRTVFVGQRGVAFVHDEHKGEILFPNKDAVLPFSMSENGLKGRAHEFEVTGKARIGWFSQAYVGLEHDASRPGELPFTRLRRSVVQLGTMTQELLDSELNEQSRSELLNAVAEARRRAGGELGSRLPERADPVDWGYVRKQGRWEFVGALVAGEDRVEFYKPGKAPTMNPPSDRGEVTWRSVTALHPDATDVVTDRDSGFAVVVTPDFLYVHEASRTSLGREVRRIPSNGERVVSAFWGGTTQMDAWARFMRG
jgi:hypothetical protein